MDRLLVALEGVTAKDAEEGTNVDGRVGMRSFCNLYNSAYGIGEYRVQNVGIILF